MRPSESRRLRRLAYFEYKVTKQISTGNGESYLAQSERPPGAFVRVDLGYGADERPCKSGSAEDGYCLRPCTLEHTLENLDTINQEHLQALDARDTLSVPDRISSVDGDVRDYFGLKPAPMLNARGQVTAQAPAPPRSKQRLSSADAQRQLRAQARRAGLRVVKGEYVDERPRTWTPDDPNQFGRRDDKQRDAYLIAQHKASR